MRELPHLPDTRYDDAIDGLVDHQRELAPLAAFLAELRAAGREGPEPRVGTALATVLRGEPDATARTPRWRRVEAAGRRIRTRVAAAVAATMVGVVGVGAAGALPGPAQDAADRAFEAVGIDRPGADDHSDIDTGPGPDVQPAGGQQPAGAGVDGGDVSDRARAGEASEDGRDFGADVSDDATEHAPGAPTETDSEVSPAGPSPAEPGATPADPAPIDEAPPTSTPDPQASGPPDPPAD